MRLVQHLINIATVLGILAAVFGFSYAGYLLVAKGSEPGARSDAATIFRKVAIGFIIMLVAWSVVYQLLSWLTGSSGFATLLGSPS